MSLDALHQRLTNAGCDEKQLALLRRALASSEDIKMLRAIAIAASELGETVADGLLDAVADLKDRVCSKLLALGHEFPCPSRQRSEQPPRDAVTPAVAMTIGPWETGSDGIRTRKIWNAADEAPPL